MHQISKIFFVALFGVIFSCIHNVNIPIQNDSPNWINNLKIIQDTLFDTLYYPEAIICTLVVEDNNDNKIEMTDANNIVQCKQLDFNLGPKRVLLTYDSLLMGTFTGELFISDTKGTDTLPYKITKIFLGKFSDSINGWRLYKNSQVLRTQDAIQFDCSGGNTGNGIVSQFQLSDTFELSVELSSFTLFGNMEFRFFVSSDTSADDFFYENESGIGVSFSYPIKNLKWINENGSPQTELLKFDAGIRFNILRKEKDITFYTFDEIGSIDSIKCRALNGPLFVHFNFNPNGNCSAGDRCRWKNFRVLRGKLNFIGR